ncbi:Hint domain-containing protein [Aliiruegeria sabulilitoris]|uniref:Hint domain-containing protein n=1 Tax=Aliiruegeria sabulilitoris TaxID=1510458 RepID=UPI00082E3C3F|nr:Hint domain-containing protein [Aliiruegeria sabulilitoris]NDR56001.1 Hint domain-containing protein [Pseudoruegeria sp. M32A2M]
MVEITAQNSEFAVSSGSNVGVTSTTSGFDAPPETYDSLVITSHSEDDSPYLFETGETYSISFSGPQGNITLTDATVLRSDLLGSQDVGAVVFEGTDSEHGVVQVIWTPNFDVDQWYNDVTNSGRIAQFYNYDTQEATYGHVCFCAGTHILTAHGPRPVETLAPGDWIQTRDNGLQPVEWVSRRSLLGVGSAAPVYFAPGAIGNTAPLHVSQQHRMLVTGAPAELLFAEPEVLVPAKALVNGDTIRIVPQRQVCFLHVLLEGHEILEAEGAPAESLLLGDVACGTLGKTPGALPPARIALTGDMQAARRLLSVQEALALPPMAFGPQENRHLHRLTA